MNILARAPHPSASDIDVVEFTYTGSSFAPKFSVSAGKTVTLSWGDGTSTVINGAVTNVIYTHNYAVSGTYQFRVVGDLDGVTKFQYNFAALSGDINTLKFFTSLTYLSLYNTSVSGDIANLSGLTSLTYLSLSNTSVSGDIANLSGLTSLTYLSLYSTSVSGDIANLSGLTSLTYLYLSNTSVSGDIANLSGLTSLISLYLSSTSVSGDIANLSGLTSLTSLYLHSTSVNIYTQGVLPDWDSCNIYIYNLGLSQQEVDDFLCDLDTASSTSTKVLDIAGTNAVPSATGLTCKSSLESKGWTVTVST